jgi:hypothetical protein
MEPFFPSQPKISKHLNMVKRAGLVVRGRNGQRIGGFHGMPRTIGQRSR